MLVHCGTLANRKTACKHKSERALPLLCKAKLDCSMTTYHIIISVVFCYHHGKALLISSPPKLLAPRAPHFQAQIRRLISFGASVCDLYQHLIFLCARLCLCEILLHHGRSPDHVFGLLPRSLFFLHLTFLPLHFFFSLV